ncbi:CDP-diacylglycerol--glycerol-3-phosphate 3-phosphatidyltransferase [bacterium]|nr:CDP-diacylglycerol--glycerol-3-phosphate 3-phosphatidyltransferase [bacterium]
MNMPNKLTLLRVILAPIFMVFFLFENFYMRLIGLGLFVIAALTDMADGYYARKFGIITGFGKFMDPLADKVLVSSALVSFIALGFVSAIPVMLIIGREFFITGLRLLAAYRGVVIPPSWPAKVKTFLQMVVVGVVMAYICLLTTFTHYQSDALHLLEFDYRLYFNYLLWFTAAWTVWTGIDYVIKYTYLIKTALK